MKFTILEGKHFGEMKKHSGVIKQNQNENSIWLHVEDVGCINYMLSLGLTVRDKEVKWRRHARCQNYQSMQESELEVGRLGDKKE